MKLTAIIFDFNGTMFLDNSKNEAAWRKLIYKYTGKNVSREEWQRVINGRPNPETIRYYIDPHLSNEETMPYSREKEDLYLQTCLEDQAGLHLTEGLPQYLDYLKAQGVALNIATSADRHNLDFYIEHMHLGKWFDLDKIVYANGKRPGKPAPDVYLEAAQKINVQPEQCLIYEDTAAGILSATAAHAGRVIGIIEKGSEDTISALPQVKNIIHDFTDIPLLESFRE